METGTDTGKQPLMRHDGSVPAGEVEMTFADGIQEFAEAVAAVEDALRRREESQRWAEEEYEYDMNEAAKDGER